MSSDQTQPDNRDKEKDPPQTLSQWLQHAREPFLNFARNLTPQILLGTLAWVMLSKLDLRRFDLSNWPLTCGFYVLLTLFAYSIYANTTLFLRGLFPGLLPWIDSQQAAMRSAKVHPRKFPAHLAKAIWREQRLQVALALLAIVMLEFVLAGVVVSSLASALNFLRIARGG